MDVILFFGPCEALNETRCDKKKHQVRISNHDTHIPYHNWNQVQQEETLNTTNDIVDKKKTPDPILYVVVF